MEQLVYEVSSVSLKLLHIIFRKFVEHYFGLPRVEANSKSFCAKSTETLQLEKTFANILFPEFLLSFSTFITN